MHVCRLLAAIIGAILAIALATTEIVCVLTDASTPMPIRMWTLTIVALALLGPLGLAILERLDKNRELLTELVAKKRAEKELKDIQRRMQRGSRTIEPEE